MALASYPTTCEDTIMSSPVRLSSFTDDIPTATAPGIGFAFTAFYIAHRGRFDGHDGDCRYFNDLGTWLLGLDPRQQAINDTLGEGIHVHIES